MSLRKLAFSAIRWTSFGSAIKSLLQIAQLTVLARILGPNDYGLMAIVTVVVGIASIFSDLGLNNVLLQQREVSNDQRASIYWINLVISAFTALLVISLSPMLSYFYNDDRLVPLLNLSSSIFIITALGAQIRIAAEKRLLFKPVMLIEITASIVGFAVAIFLAVNHCGVYSLLIAAILNALTASILLWAFLSQGWRPKFIMDISAARPLIRHGAAFFANNLVNQVALSFDIFLGARALPAAEIGNYSIPRNLILQIQFAVNPIVTRVTFPVIAEIQADVGRVKRTYLHSLRMTASINSPIYIGIYFYSNEIVGLILGNNWNSSIVLLQVLSIWGLFRSTMNPIGSLMLGLGRADLAFKWGIYTLIFAAPVVWLGAANGVIWLALALLGLSILWLFLGWFYLTRPLCNARLRETMDAIFRPTLIAITSLSITSISGPHSSNLVYNLAYGIIVGVVLYVGISCLFNRVWLKLMLEFIWWRKK